MKRRDNTLNNAAKYFLFCAVAVLIAPVLSVHGASATATPLDQIKKSVDEILVILEDPGYKEAGHHEEQRQLIVTIVKNRFDFEEMSRRVLASNWKTISKQEQLDFVELFAQLLEATYVKKLEQYSGQKVVFTREKIQGKRAVVESNVTKDGIETPLIYRLTQKSNDWLVYDVVIEGVSLVSNYRSQFANIINNEKFNGLMAKLNDKIIKLEQ